MTELALYALLTIVGVAYLCSGVVFACNFAWCLGMPATSQLNLRKKLKYRFSLLGMIVGWLGLVVWFLIRPDLFKGMDSTTPRVLYECCGKGGMYAHQGRSTFIIQPPLLDSPFYTLIWKTQGAGLRRDEATSVWIDNATGKLVHYSTRNNSPIIIYSDIDSGKYYHREEADFIDRMKRIN